VDRYKTLLLKQRDIMIALTARLNERDEQIVTLQVGLWLGVHGCGAAQAVLLSERISCCLPFIRYTFQSYGTSITYPLACGLPTPAGGAGGVRQAPAQAGGCAGPEDGRADRAAQGGTGARVG
jgi:hypothetical protein